MRFPKARAMHTVFVYICHRAYSAVRVWQAAEAAHYANEEGLILRNAVLDFGLMSGDDFNSQVNLSKMLGPKNSGMGNLQTAS